MGDVKGLMLSDPGTLKYTHLFMPVCIKFMRAPFFYVENLKSSNSFEFRYYYFSIYQFACIQICYVSYTTLHM